MALRTSTAELLFAVCWLPSTAMRCVLMIAFFEYLPHIRSRLPMMAFVVRFSRTILIVQILCVNDYTLQYDRQHHHPDRKEYVYLHSYNDFEILFIDDSRAPENFKLLNYIFELNLIKFFYFFQTLTEHTFVIHKLSRLLTATPAKGSYRKCSNLLGQLSF